MFLGGNWQINPSKPTSNRKKKPKREVRKEFQNKPILLLHNWSIPKEKDIILVKITPVESLSAVPTGLSNQ